MAFYNNTLLHHSFSSKGRAILLWIALFNFFLLPLPMALFASASTSRRRWFRPSTTLLFGTSPTFATNFDGWRVLFHYCLQLPPSARLMLGQADALKRDCQKVVATISSNDDDGKKFLFSWQDDVECCDYQFATRVFESIAVNFGKSPGIALWFPKLDDSEQLLGFVQVLTDNSDRLGGLTINWSSWPKTPATMIQLSWPSTNFLQEEKGDYKMNRDDDSSISSAIKETEIWVEEKLCRLGLCPYTYSLQRAAVGLESVGVKEGPIVIRHASSRSDIPAATTSAAVLGLEFWKSVSAIATESEQDVATFLIVAPRWYDDEFQEFAKTFDELIEPSVQATQTESIVGRAIFHPRYDSNVIGHSEVLPGHAIPAKMVEGFVDRYRLVEDENITNGQSQEQDHSSSSKKKRKRPDLDTIAKANDAVRWTPHATINLLRRSQLSASKIAEAASSNKRPNWIYARNVLRIIKSGMIE